MRETFLTGRIPARALHRELSEAVDQAEREVAELRVRVSEWGGEGDKALLRQAEKRLEKAVTKLRIAEGRA